MPTPGIQALSAQQQQAGLSAGFLLRTFLMRTLNSRHTVMRSLA